MAADERSIALPNVVTGARAAAPPPLPTTAQRALTFGLLISALRCTVQYVLLPFVLPWVGVAASIPRWVLLVLGAIAIASLARNVRTMWRVRHARRWSYLMIAAVVIGTLILFTVFDLRTLLF